MNAQLRPVRCSPLEAWYRAHGRRPRLIEGMELPAELVEAAPAAPGLRLTDLSWRRRFGCKGPAAEGWLAGAGFGAPKGANRLQVGTGVLIARLATSEFLVEALDGNATVVETARRELESERCPIGVYPVARQDLVVEITGEATGALLRQVCNVDFAPLLRAAATAERAVVLTSMVGVGVIAWPRGGEKSAAVTLWTDPSFAHYFWTTLLEVGGELPGGVAIAVPGASAGAP